MKLRTAIATAMFLSTGACGSPDIGESGPNRDHENGEITGDTPDDNRGEQPGAPPPSQAETPTTDPRPEASLAFYVDPDSNPATWVKNNGGDARASSIRTNIASKPMARWFGNWSGDIRSAVSSYVGAAAAANKWPILVAYNIPGRDCGGHSGGGAGSAEAFRTWIAAFAAGVGNAQAIVVVEPDALAQLECLPSDAERQIRTDLLRYATEQFRAKAPNARTYLDGGNAKWIQPGAMATRLDAAGVRNVRGFAVNVSNFYTNDESNTYGKAINSTLSGQYGYTVKFVVDSSRNGNGSNGGEWCNPAGRKLGAASSAGTGGAESFLWLKVPGDSDGQCGTAPGTPAGTFSPDLAVHLIDGK